jgi:hypothetical protein
VKLSDVYNELNPTQELPLGAVCRVEVVLFEDGSIYVGGPCNSDGPTQVAALKTALVLMESDDVVKPDAADHAMWTKVAEG